MLVFQFFFGTIAGLLGVFFLCLCVYSSRLRRLVQRMPTRSIRHLIQEDFVELRGKVSCDEPLTAPVSGSPCVYYDYKLQKIKHHSHHSGGGSSGPTYRTIDSDRRHIPFVLTDETGSIPVDPHRARFDAALIVDRRVRPGEEIPGGRKNPTRPRKQSREDKALEGLFGAIVRKLGGKLKHTVATKNPHRFQVRAVKPSDDVYILGTVKPDPDGSLRIAKGRSRFFISAKSEEQLLAKLRKDSIVGLIAGPLLLTVSGVFLAWAFLAL